MCTWHYLLLAVKNVQIQKPGDHKMTGGGEGDQATKPNSKPEDILKLVMTAGDEKPNQPINRTRQPSKQGQAGKPYECEHNPCIHALMVLQYFYKLNCCNLCMTHYTTNT